MLIKLYIGDSYNAISCNHYHVTKLECGAVEVTLYPTLRTTDGVTYRVAGFESRSSTPHFDCCEVIDTFGVTIEEIYGSNSEIIKNKG